MPLSARRPKLVLVGVLLVITAACASPPTVQDAGPPPADTGTTVIAPPGRPPVAAARWTALAPSPLVNQTGFLSVWTGTELLVCCGVPNTVASPEAPTPPSAAAYNPTTDAWRPIQAPPTAAQSWGSVTVIGDTVYLLDGGTQPWAYEAYDIGDDVWRSLPPPPLNASRPADSRLGTSAWNGTEIVSVLTTNPASDHDLAVVAFDPATEAWRTLPPPPVRLEPTSLTADGATLTLLGEQRRPADQKVDLLSVTFDTTTDQWQPARPTGLARRDPGAMSSGPRVIVWDVAGHVRVKDGGEWADQPTIPFPEDECGWRGAQVDQRVVLWRCTQQGAVLDTDTGTWSTLPSPPTDLLGDNLISLGNRLVLWARGTDQLQPYRLDLD